jgi:hypothetical protein
MAGYQEVRSRGSPEELRFAVGNEKSPHVCGDFEQ